MNAQVQEASPPLWRGSAVSVGPGADAVLDLPLCAVDQDPSADTGSDRGFEVGQGLSTVVFCALHQGGQQWRQVASALLLPGGGRLRSVFF